MAAFYYVVFTETIAFYFAKISHNFINFKPRKSCQLSGQLFLLKPLLLVEPPRHVELKDDRTETYVQTLRKELNDAKIQIVVILFPSLRDDRYSAIKRVLCTDIPLPSQVILSKTLRNDTKNRSIVQKIILQMNCKVIKHYFN